MHTEVFHRPARRFPVRLPTQEIIIDEPPRIPSAQQAANIWMQLLPMAGSVVFAVIFVINAHNPLVAVASAVGLACMIGATVVLRSLQRRSVKAQRERQRQKYTSILDNTEANLQAIAAKQRQVSARVSPAVNQLPDLIERREQLWERRMNNADFLSVRVGIGQIDLCSPIRLNTSQTADYEEDLYQRAQQVANQYALLEHAPFPLALRSAGTVALTGDRTITRAAARALLLQIVTFHAPTDVRIAATFPLEATHEWEWLKWLPHTRTLSPTKQEDPQAPRPLCLLADNPDDWQQLLSTQLEWELDRRRNAMHDRRNDSSMNSLKPHLVVLVDGYNPHDSLAPAINDLSREAAQLGMTVFCLVDSRSQEPSATQIRLALSVPDQTGAGTVPYARVTSLASLSTLPVSAVISGWTPILDGTQPVNALKANSQQPLEVEELREGGLPGKQIQPDRADPRLCDRVARSLARLSLADEVGEQRDLTQNVRLLELLGIESIDVIDRTNLTSLRALKEQELLRTTIGVHAEGHPLVLDLKEASKGGNGPHGILIGTTGTGKSELLRTLIVGLALRHSTETLNFVLADFKGGATFAKLGDLPHVAGTITNIENDPTLVNRLKDALAGEVDRRQRLLLSAGAKENIWLYYEKRHRDSTLEPLPHLMVIVDEFAKLLDRDPEFMKVFDDIGAQGRSLGIHLLLATQRLDEGKFDKLLANLSYRICLRTEEPSHSVAVLKTSDAHYLPKSPGVGYFKEGSRAPVLFKAAWITSPYLPAGDTITAAAAVRKFTPTGQVVSIGSGKAAWRSSRDELDLDDAERLEAPTELDAVIDQITVADQTKGRRIWLPPLQGNLLLGDVLARCDLDGLNGSHWDASPPLGLLKIPVGLIDKPSEQAQVPLTLNFTGDEGHLAIVGAPQSGKSTLLTTIIAAFMVTHSPYDVQFYGIDSSGSLHAFEREQAPHIGAIASLWDREKVTRILRHVQALIDTRAQLFRTLGVTNMQTYRTQRHQTMRGAADGDVFLIIDNWEQFRGDFQMLDDEVIDIAARGLNFGVHLIVTNNRWAGINQKLQVTLGNRLELRLQDPTESQLAKRVALTLPTHAPGRGLIKGGLLVQIALPSLATREGLDDVAIQRELEDLIHRADKSWSGPRAHRVHVLPAIVKRGELPQPIPGEPAGVPIGLEESQFEPVYLDLFTPGPTYVGPHFLILGDASCGKTTALRAWIQGLESRYSPNLVRIAIVDYDRKLLDCALGSKLLLEQGYAHTPELLHSLVQDLDKVLQIRQRAIQQAPLEQLRATQVWEGPRYVVFVDDAQAVLLAPSPMSTPPLTTLVARSVRGQDLGLHMVMARRITQANTDQNYIRLKQMGSAGLIMNGNPAEGPILGNQRAFPMPIGRGYLVRNSQRTVQVQIVQAESGKAEASGDIDAT